MQTHTMPILTTPRCKGPATNSTSCRASSTLAQYIVQSKQYICAAHRAVHWCSACEAACYDFCSGSSHQRGGEVGSRAVSTSQPLAVTRTWCSNCALLAPSSVTAVHPSGQVLSRQEPAAIKPPLCSYQATDNHLPSSSLASGQAGQVLCSFPSAGTHQP
jgi:hypothetical protein